MTYVFIGAAFALGAFLIADLLFTAWMVSLFALMRRAAATWAPAQGRRLFAAARVLPSALALLFVGLVVVPGYVRLEPRDARETAGPILLMLALLSAALLLTGPMRALRAWRATRRLEAQWLRAADRVDLPSVGFPVWRVRTGANGLWMSGLLRPRVIVGAAVLDALTPLELAAALRHEVAHVAGRDNLLRLCLAGCPGTLSILPFGRVLERHWSRAAEALADGRASAGAPAAAVDLASALVKVARLRPPDVLFAASALDEGDVGARVHRLLDDDGGTAPSRVREMALWVALLIPLAVIAALAADPAMVGLLHSAGEQLVRRY